MLDFERVQSAANVHESEYHADTVSMHHSLEQYRALLMGLLQHAPANRSDQHGGSLLASKLARTRNGFRGVHGHVDNAVAET
jgi:hypothetical protein